MIPSWLQYLQAFAVVAIPPIGAWLAWQQVQIARVKLQHDLYDRRYRVFDATRRLLANTCATGYASDEAQLAFVLGTGDAAFLFDDDLTRYLEEMRKRAVTLQTISNALETLPVGAQRTRFVNVKSEHEVWFTKLLDSLADNFKPFLKLDKRQRARRRWYQNGRSLIQRALWTPKR